MQRETFVHAAGGINWYCERRGQGQAVVLVPSGEGDCASFEAVATALADTFTVLTFDTPGFSRSGAPADAAQISVATLGDQVAALVRSLGIERATFYGCSSGGRAVLDLAVRHADLIRSAVVHEVATHLRSPGDRRSQACTRRPPSFFDRGIEQRWRCGGPQVDSARAVVREMEGPNTERMASDIDAL